MLTRTEQQTGAIEKYASFLTEAAGNWTAIKAAAGLAHDQPGSRHAYRDTGLELLSMAHEQGIAHARAEPFQAGTLAIMRHQFILAVKSRELGFDTARAARFARNRAAYAGLARIAAQPRPLALALERRLGLVNGLNPEEPAFWINYGQGTDRHGEPGLLIHNLADVISCLAEDETMRYKIDDHREDRPGRKDGCLALHSGWLRPIQAALADIVVADPELLGATLQAGGD